MDDDLQHSPQYIIQIYNSLNNFDLCYAFYSKRKHNFWKFKKLCQSNGFTLENNYCHHFSFFPAPLSTLTNPFLARIESNLDILGKTPLKIFCGTNLLVLRKTCEI